MPRRPDQKTKLPPVLWQGSFRSAHSLAKVNRELVGALRRLDPEWQLSLIADEHGAQLPEGFDTGERQAADQLSEFRAVVRHQFPPDWSALPGATVYIQPWEFGVAPEAWVKALGEGDRRLWTPSEFSRQSFVLGGLSPDLVRVVPNGIDPEVYSPNGKKLDLAKQGALNADDLKGRTKFLFVGGTIQRKGIDLVIDAYRQTFTRNDPVALVVKDFGAQDVYSRKNWSNELREMANDPQGPVVAYIDRTMTEAEMASLMRACDCLIAPYRAEGFGLPILEAMACGLATIVTNAGPAPEFCSPSTSWLIDAEIRELGQLSDEYRAAKTPFWHEPILESLCLSMKTALEQAAERKQKGAWAAAVASGQFSWDAAAIKAAEALDELHSAEKKTTYYDMGRSWLDHGQSALALTALTRSAMERPDDPRTREALVTALLQQNRWQEAEETLEKILRVHPDDVGLRAQRVWLRLYSQRETEAIEDALWLIDATEPDAGLKQETLAPLRDFCLASGMASEAARLTEAIGDNGPIEPVGTKISLVMIAKNEAEMLPDCLKAAKGAFDEFILVDTGSADSTINIAKANGAKVIEREWTDDFSAARNAGLAQATGEWILWLDADERLTPESIEIIRTAAHRPQFGAYYIEIVNLLDGESKENVFVHRAVRLFRRTSFAKWTGRLHEQVLEAFQSNGYKAANLQGAQIIHLGYDRKMMEARGKGERNIRLLEQSLAEAPDDAFQLFNLANTLFDLAQYDQALDLLDRACELIEPFQDFAAVAWSQRITCLYSLGRVQEACQVGAQAVARGIDHPLLWYSYAEACNLSEKYKDALNCLEKARQRAIETGLMSQSGQLMRSSGFVGDPHIITYKWHYTRARALLGLRKTKEAEQEAEKALELNPGYPEASYLLAELKRLDGRFEQADKHYEHALKSAKIAIAASKDRANMHWGEGDFKKAGTAFEAACVLDPGDETCWHRWMHCGEQTQDPEMVVRAFKFLEERDMPVSVDARVNWGRAYWALGRPEEGLEQLMLAVQADPNNANALFNAGDAIYQLGAYGDAADVYSAALRIDGSNADGWFVLGNCYYRLGVYDAAKIAFKRCIALDPQHRSALQNLALTEEALKMTAA
ncbi:MAG: tetratricopeptide repeat protein [Armatimonadetes bacterium]|nr:tetratricopeptide repeat protein [Armatimonadota bacterium]